MIRWITTLTLLLTPALAFAGGDGFEPKVFWFFVVDCIVLFGAMAYFVRPKLAQHFKERSEAVARDLNEAKTLKEEAEALLEDYEAKMARMEQETNEILERFKSDGEQEKARIIAEAQAESQRLRKEAEFRISQEAKKAKEELREEAAVLAVDLARKALEERLDAKTKDRLFEEAVGKLKDIRPEQVIQS